MPWSSIKMRLATAEDLADSSIEHFDFTKLSAINTCPTWGILRYGMHKAMPGSGTSAALVAGKLMHECFSVIRLNQLWHTHAQPALADVRGHELFGSSGRWDSIRSIIAREGNTVDRIGRDAALECLSSGDWVDDPYDTRRTYAALETSLLYYAQRWDYDRYPIWVSEDGSKCGVEIPFGILVEASHGEPLLLDGNTKRFILTGRIDGLHRNDKHLIVQENKTASRLNDAWSLSFEVSHQPTGYMVAASLFAQEQCDQAAIMGLQIPLPRNMSDGMLQVNTRRPEFMKHNWMRWLEHTITLYDSYKLDVVNAPMYTHSCNRYFRPCSFIPFCTADQDERKQIVAEMSDDKWSPLAED
jgi:hypothetical protein